MKKIPGTCDFCGLQTLIFELVELRRPSYIDEVSGNPTFPGVMIGCLQYGCSSVAYAADCVSQQLEIDRKFAQERERMIASGRQDLAAHFGHPGQKPGKKKDIMKRTWQEPAYS